jgi:hypothetical protein
MRLPDEVFLAATLNIAAAGILNEMRWLAIASAFPN